MENRQQQILSEIKEMMSSIRKQLELLDAKMAEFQYEVDPQEFTVESFDLNLDDLPVVEPAPEVVVEPAPEVVVEPAPEVVVEQAPEPVAEPVVEPVVEPDPVFEPTPEPVAEPAPVEEVETELEMVFEAAQTIAAEKPVVLDAMTTKQAWRTDMPGAAVRDIRSAISLNDRVLFINRLFDEDPVMFQETLTRLNQVETLDDAVAYLAETRPQWDLESEIVYRFMMALRRKISR
jgi:hypothetical protein